MKVFIASLALVTLASAETRRLHGGGKGRGGGKRGDWRASLQAKVAEQCDSESFVSACPADRDAIKCEFAKPDRGERPDWKNLTEDEKAALKAERETGRDAFHAELALCVCCTENTFDGVMPEREERPPRPDREDRPDREERMEERCAAMVCAEEDTGGCEALERPAAVDWVVLQESPEGMALHQEVCSAYREQLAVCVCCTDATLEELSFGPEEGGCRPGRGGRGPRGGRGGDGPRGGRGGGEGPRGGRGGDGPRGGRGGEGPRGGRDGEGPRGGRGGEGPRGGRDGEGPRGGRGGEGSRGGRGGEGSRGGRGGEGSRRGRGGGGSRGGREGRVHRGGRGGGL